MTAIILCLAAFLVTCLAARRSLVHGLIAVLATGYCYGILRANVINSASHFIFDASLGGLYFVQLWAKQTPEGVKRSATLRAWVATLIGWPIFVCFLPFQTLMVTLVGLRGNIFFLPLCLFGPRMKSHDWHSLSVAVAALNLTALSFGLAEYFLGLERFYPVSAVTAIIYASRDVAGFQFYRIPATFTNAHSYAGTMVFTLPLLIGAWARPAISLVRRFFLLSGIAAAAVGVLLANARIHVVAAAVIALSALLFGNLSARKRAVWCAALVAVGLLALSNDRFQRFLSLGDADAVAERISGSVNRTFLEILTEYPMGNGLGGGGTSIPSFLEGQVVKPVQMESEYARILLEQGVIGLLIWICFVIQFLRSTKFGLGEWAEARRLTWVACATFFATAMIGTGLLTSIPQTALMILGLGWVMTPPEDTRPFSMMDHSFPVEYEAEPV